MDSVAAGTRPHATADNRKAHTLRTTYQKTDDLDGGKQSEMMGLRNKRRKVKEEQSYGESSSEEEHSSYSSESRGESGDESFNGTNATYLSETQPPPASFTCRLAKYDGPITPTSIFNLFLDDDVIQMIVDMTNLYAHRNKGDSKEIRLFLAILLLSGYNSLLRRSMYWETRSDTHNECVANAMPQNRFDLLMKYIHFGDHAYPDENDKIWKIRKLFNAINKRCLPYATYGSDLSIEESMIPYFGRKGCKQRITNKPVRLGYKMWVLVESNGYLINFDLYQGAKGRTSTQVSPTTWGLGEKVVLLFLEVLPKRISYNVFFDNYFTSFRLLKHLQINGIRATGTLNKGKLNKVPVQLPESLEKQPLGHYEKITVNNNAVTLVGWNDNRVVSLASNVYPAVLIKQVKPWDTKQKQFIVVP